MIEYNISQSRIQQLTLFHSILWQTELDELRKLYEYPVHYIKMEIDAGFFDFLYSKVVTAGNRRGEVCLAVEFKNKVLLHTKSKYPNGIYRLPTGGINYDESVLKALGREVYEETGLSVRNELLIAVLLYELAFQERSVPFMSFIFGFQTETTNLYPVDESEGITGFKWIPRSELVNIARRLEKSPGEWGAWGQFRALAHKILVKHY
ncbi:NUDIX hydrolase [candidate division KSB1 bacterium]|nr:NUDIX hydrolase [candidate division KSB1 bacterium]